MVCKYCKRTINDDSIFCQYCGEKTVASKRSKNKSIHVPKPKLTPNGRYQGQLMCHGQRQYIVEDTEAAYYAVAKAFKSGVLKIEKKKPQLAPDITLHDVVTKYIHDNEPVLSPSTASGYGKIARVNFQEYINMDVKKIPWQTMISEEANRLSPKTVRNAWALIKSSLEYSKLPVPSVKLPKLVQNEREFLDYEQIQVFLEAIKGHPYELIYLLALHSLRDSELKALTRESFRDGFIIINGARVRTKQGLEFKKANKTEKSRRNVPIMIDRVNELIDKWEFPISTVNCVINRNLKKVCANNGLPDISLHCLRHSFASLAYHLKWSEKTTMRIGGWSTPDVVNRIYTHLAEHDLNDDIRKMKEFYYTADNKVEQREEVRSKTEQSGVKMS